MSSTPGIATRLCMMNGIWAEPNILECESQQFYDLRLQVTAQCMLYIILYIDKQLTVIRHVARRSLSLYKESLQGCIIKYSIMHACQHAHKGLIAVIID